MSYRIPTTCPDYNSQGGLAELLDLAYGVQTVAAATSTPITIKEGHVFVTYSGIATMTLAAPVAGLRSAGGDDGCVLRIVDVGGYAHTITTGSSGINGSKHVITMGYGSPLAAAAGNAVSLIAKGGVWYTISSTNTLT